jgi:hypothetical protein
MGLCFVVAVLFVSIFSQISFFFLMLGKGCWFEDHGMTGFNFVKR